MRHPLRHALICVWFLCLFLYGLRAPTDSPLRADIAKLEDVYELTVESWSHAKRSQVLATASETRNGFLLYAGTSLPNASDVFDDRTFVADDLYADFHVRIQGGFARHYARRSLRVQSQRDRRRRKLQERIARVLETTTTSAAATNTSWHVSVKADREQWAHARRELAAGPLGVDRLDRIVRKRIFPRSDVELGENSLGEDGSDESSGGADKEDYGNMIVMDKDGHGNHPSADVQPLLPLPSTAAASLEFPEPVRVPPLPASVSRTPPGEVTTVDPAHFYAVHRTYLRAYEARKRERPFQFYEWPRQRAALRPRYAWRKFYISLNLHENVEAIPYLTGALIAFLEDEIAPFVDLVSSVAISIYANASPDLTGPLVRSFLIPYLQKAGVQNIYATVKGSCGGYLKRYAQLQGRIEWMACLRNRAIAPLQKLGRHAFFYDAASNESDHRSKTALVDAVLNDEAEFLSGEGSGGGGVKYKTHTVAAEAGAFMDDDELVVLFLNDIYFRPADLTQLLESVPEPTFAATTTPDGAQRVSGQSSTQASAFPTAATTTAAYGASVFAAASSRGTSFDMACGMDFYYSFYDTWVSRDRLGKPFMPFMPYTDDAPTRAAFARILSPTTGTDSCGDNTGRVEDTEGVRKVGGIDGTGVSRPLASAIPVKCCWNGAAALRGSFFLPPRVKVTPATTTVTNSHSGATRQRQWQESASDSVKRIVYPSGLMFDPVPISEMNRWRARLHDHMIQLLAVRTHNERMHWRSYQRAAARALATASPRDAVPPANETVASIAKDLRALLAVGSSTANAALAQLLPVSAAVLREVLLYASQSSPHRDGGQGHTDAVHAFGFPMKELNETVLQRIASLDVTNRSEFVVRALPLWKQLLAPVTVNRDHQEYRGNMGGDAKGRVRRAPELWPPFPASGNFSEGDNLYLEDDGTWLTARHPVVRFRHAFTPSFGAAAAVAAAIATAPQWDEGTAAASLPFSEPSSPKTISDDVCQSSECFLICQDVMHAALLRRGKLPVILMNPRVRVAYEWEHYYRVASAAPDAVSCEETKHNNHKQGPALQTRRHMAPSSLGWLYSSPRLYRLCSLLRDARRLRMWLTSSRHHHAVKAKNSPEATTADALFPVSAADDWTRGHTSLTLHVVDSATTITTTASATAAAADSPDVVVYHVNVTQLTSMDCYRPATDDTEAIVGPLLSLLYTVLILLIVFWTLRDAVRHVEQKVAAIESRVLGAAHAISNKAGVTVSPQGSGPQRLRLLPEERVCWLLIRATRRLLSHCRRCRPSTQPQQLQLLGSFLRSAGPRARGGGVGGGVRQWVQRAAHAMATMSHAIRNLVQQELQRFPSGPRGPRRRTLSPAAATAVAASGAGEVPPATTTTPCGGVDRTANAVSVTVASPPRSPPPPPLPVMQSSPTQHVVAPAAGGHGGMLDRIRYRDTASPASCPAKWGDLERP